PPRIVDFDRRTARPQDGKSMPPDENLRAASGCSHSRDSVGVRDRRADGRVRRARIHLEAPRAFTHNRLPDLVQSKLLPRRRIELLVTAFLDGVSLFDDGWPQNLIRR